MLLLIGLRVYLILPAVFIRPELRRVKVDNPKKYKSLTIQEN